MGGRTRKQPERWQITVLPTGSPEEAALAAQQARRLVAGWILRRRTEPATEPGAGGGVGGSPC